MEENQLESPRKILERLGELRKWQEEQEKILIAKQTHQRQVLAEEQTKLYEMLGCSPHGELQQDTLKDEEENIVSGDGQFMERFSCETAKKSSLIMKPNQEAPKRSPVNKKPFLKRGEGLTSRFRVNPNHFNLKNIPKYKYSIANKKAKEKNMQSKIEDNQRDLSVKEESQNVPESEDSSNFTDASSWRKLLEAMNLDPTRTSQLFQEIAKSAINNSESLCKRSSEMDELSIFELLEEKLQNSSFSSNSSTVRKILKYDEIRQQKTPEEEPEETRTKEIKEAKEVRFCEKVEVNHFSDTSEEEDDDDDEGNMVSTPEKSLDDFLDFKANLERKLSRFSDSGSEGDSREELMSKRSDELKGRLRELEEEIEKFKKQNTTLMKEKQIHELAKIDLENRRHEMEDQLNDERIKMEIYFHDERMKIAEEKTRYEKLLKDFRVPTKKEREEVKRLKERIEELEKEVKEKTVKHGATQSRHRSQVRSLEKEIKEQSSEIELLKKENRKLEAENVRLRRQSNNKTLLEINKNIAKLTSAVPQESSGQRKKKVSPVKRMQMKDPLFSSDTDTEFEDGNETEDTPRSELPVPDKTDKDKRIGNGSTNVDLKREIVNSDGSRDIWYPNGNLKKISADGMLIRMLYFNKDIKETDINGGTVKYYYAESNTWHTTYLDGLEIFEYPNGETKHIHKDGTTEIHYPSGSVLTKRLQSDGSVQEEWQLVDGTQIYWKNGEKVLVCPNGQREIHGSDHKRREYPEGTVKIVYNDGSQETRYSNGRVRLKDPTGKLVMDSEAKSFKCDN